MTDSDYIQNKNVLLVVVDMVQGFIEHGALSDRTIRNIINENRELIKLFTYADKPVIAFLDSHRPDSKEFSFYPPHCISGTSESMLVEELQPFQDQMICIEKDTTNGFQTNEFHNYLADNPAFDEIIVIGCCTDICVLQFVLSLKTYLQAAFLDTQVTVIKNAVETFETPNHQRKEMNEFSFKLMEAAGIHLLEKLERE